MEGPVSIFQESPLAGEPRERLFHIHSVHRYQLCAKYLYPSTLLWQINCCNYWVFCASCALSCVIDWSAFSLDCFTLLLARHLADRDVKQTTFSFADGPLVCSTSLMASLIMKHVTSARCRASRSVKHFSGLQKDYKFKFKYFIASYTWQGVYRGSCNKVSHTHTWKLN